MRRPLPDVPFFSEFLEINVRLYVEYEGKPGVWFLSLDATNPFVVWGGRKFYGLPYESAEIKFEKSRDVIRYRSRRKGSQPAAGFEGEFSPSNETFNAEPTQLEHFLTERYCFYSQSPYGIRRTEVHHLPWPLQRASGTVEVNSLLEALKIEGTASPLLHYSAGVDVISWNPVPV